VYQRLRSQLVEQRLRLFQIAGLERLSKPPVDRSKKLASLPPLALIALKFSFLLKPRLVLKTIIAGQAAHQLASPPIIENAAEVLARDPGHSSKVTLSNLLVNHNAVGSDIPTEIFRELK